MNLAFAEGVFTITIENVSNDNTIKLSDFSTTSAPIAPGVWVVHAAGAKPIFNAGTGDYGSGLEVLAEDGDASCLAVNILSQTGPAIPFALMVQCGPYSIGMLRV